MIVKWNKKNGIKVIPVLKNGVIIEHLSLLPGYNDIKDEVAIDIINSGIVKESIESNMLEFLSKESVEEIEVRGKDGAKKKEKKKTISAKKLSAMHASNAEDIIKNTNNLKTLERWLKVETRDSVRMVIRNQIDYINEYIKNPDANKGEK
jgi:hypothetical protein